MGEAVFIASRFDEFGYHRSVLADQLRATGRYTVYDLNDGRAASATALERSLAFVKRASVVVVLLGDTYGHPDATGRSITHNEWSAAMDDEKPVLVYSTTSAPSDPRQAAFLAEVVRRDGDRDRVVGKLSTVAGDLPQDVMRIVESIEEAVVAVDDDGDATQGSGILREMAHMGAAGITDFRLPRSLAEAEPEYNRLIEQRRFAFRELAAGENREAREYFEQAQSIYRRDWATNYAHARLLELRQRSGDLATALALSRAAVLAMHDREHAPSSFADPDLVRRRREAHTLVCHARLLRKNGMPADAVRVAGSALELEPFNRQALVEQLLAACAAADAGAARRAVLELLKIHPDSASTVLQWRQVAPLREDLLTVAVEFVAERARAAQLPLTPPQRGVGLAETVAAFRGSVEARAAELRRVIAALSEFVEADIGGQVAWRHAPVVTRLAQARQAQTEQAALVARLEVLSARSLEPAPVPVPVAQAERRTAEQKQTRATSAAAYAHRRRTKAERAWRLRWVLVAFVGVYVSMIPALLIQTVLPDVDEDRVDYGALLLGIPLFVGLVAWLRRRRRVRAQAHAAQADAALAAAVAEVRRATAAVAEAEDARQGHIEAAWEHARARDEVAEIERRLAAGSGGSANVDQALDALAEEGRRTHQIASRHVPELLPPEAAADAEAVVGLLVRRARATLSDLNRAAGQFPSLALADYVPVRRASPGQLTRVRASDPVTASGGLSRDDARVVRVLRREGDVVVVSDLAAWAPPPGKDLTAGELRHLERLEQLMDRPVPRAVEPRVA